MERRGRIIRNVGYVGTAAYLVFLIIYSAAMWSTLLEMSPHDFAECLAGAFGPVAFLWVVLGYIQQGDELRHSAKALYLQGEELRLSVEQQRQMVAISREQLEADAAVRNEDAQAADAAARPRLRLLSDGAQWDGESKRFSFVLRNLGPVCTDVILYPGDELGKRKDFLEGDAGLMFALEYKRGEKLEAVGVEVTYVASNGKPGTAYFLIPASDDLNMADMLLTTPMPMENIEDRAPRLP